MAQLATNEQCEFVVVCGDVFESNQVQRQVLVRAFEKMAAFPQLTFFLLPGNHDPLDASSIYNSPTFIERRPENVKVLRGFEPVQAAPGVELIPAPWPNKHPTTDLVEAACGRLEQTSSLRIIVGHGVIDSMSPDPSDPKAIALERLEERISAGLIHYVALGDRHSTTNVSTTGRVYYSGTPEPTDYDETDPGNVLIVDPGADHVDVVVKNLGVRGIACGAQGGGLPAPLEEVALPVHLKDVDAVSEAVQECTGEPLGAEDRGPLVEGRVGGDQDRSSLVALAEDFEQ